MLYCDLKAAICGTLVGSVKYAPVCVAADGLLTEALRMPELPEVEVVRRSLAAQVVGVRIRHVEVVDGRLRNPVQCERLIQAVSDRVITGVGRRGKYLLLSVEGNHTVLIHLGMSGNLRIVSAVVANQRHDHVLFFLGDGRQLRFNDPRRFGLVEVCLSSEILVHPLLNHLGCEPLDDRFSCDYFFEQTRQRTLPIKNFLMDSRRVVGIGNIYASEALFVARIHPLRKTGRIGRKRCGLLVEAIREVLGEAIETGGTTLRDFQDIHGNEGTYVRRLQVYGRANEPCRVCSRLVKRVVLAGRSTYYCGFCQR